MSIDEFIKIVAPKLNNPTQKSFGYMSGKDLKLTGYGEMGVEINDNEIYKIPVPTEIQTDHTKKLRLAWLRGGKLAVKKYLLKHLPEQAVEQIIQVL